MVDVVHLYVDHQLDRHGDRRHQTLSLLAAMGVSLAMAQAVPDAFEDGGAWFAVTYFIVRLISVALSWLGPGPTRPSERRFSLFFRWRQWRPCWYW